MTTKLTQALVDRANEDHSQGTQVYDDEVSGLRLVVGKKSASWKLVGRINDGTDRYVSIIIGRADEVSLKTARTRATELRLALRRGEDPRRQKVVVPTVEQAMGRYIESRGKDLRPRTVEFYKGSYDDIVQMVKAAHPEAETTPRSIASVASVLRKKGADVPMRRGARADRL